MVMKSIFPAILLVAVAALLVWGCSAPEPLRAPVRVEMNSAARLHDWALIFFQSWRENRRDEYLNLSRSHMASAVKTYFELQLRIGHSFPDFYTIDRRRRTGCRFLDEIDRLAARFRVPLASTSTEGCVKA